MALDLALFFIKQNKMVGYKQKCSKCKKNYVVVFRTQPYILCYDCQKPELEGKIDDLKMKKLFNISEELYKESAFLRNIKANYIRYGNLSEKQIEAFKKVVSKLKELKKNK